MIGLMERERLDGVLTVKVPARWLELLDGLGDPEERDRGKVVRKILRDVLRTRGLLLDSDSSPPAGPKTADRTAVRRGSR